MKRILAFIALVMTSLFLASCQELGDSIDFEDIYEEIHLEDTFRVEEDFEILAVSKYENIEITWESSHPDSLRIDVNMARVTRKDIEVTVTLTVHITINKELEASKSYQVIVSKIKGEVTFDGLIDMTYVIGEEKPNYMGHIKVEDQGIDVTSEVTYDDTLVNYEVVGTYQVTYTYQTYQQTIKVFVIEDGDNTAPIISGTKAFTYVIGEDMPNYLEGVSAFDEVDGAVEVTYDDSLVNYEVVGVYVIKYYATDQASNQASVSQKVTVIAPISEDQVVIETFDQIGAASSSYKDGTFTGVEGIVWSYVSSRTDQALDGSALTFGDKTIQSKLSAEIDGGLQAISFDAKHAFGGGAIRGVSLYINDTFIKDFDVLAGEAQTFKVEGLDIKGSYYLEIRNTDGLRVTIDTIRLYPNNLTKEEMMLAEDYKALQIQTQYFKEAALVLPEQVGHSLVKWSFLDPSDLNNSYIDLEQKTVSMPLERQVHVGVVATMSYSGYTKTKTFTLTLGEGDPISIKAVLEQVDQSEIKTQGVVSFVWQEEGFTYAFIEDQSGAILIAHEGLLETLIRGQEIIIKASKDQVDGAARLVEVTSIQYLRDQEVSPRVLKDLFDQQGRYVTFEGYIYRTYESETRLLQVTNGQQYTVEIKQSAIEDILSSEGILGAQVLFNGYVYQDRVMVFEALGVLDRLNDEEKLSIILDHMDMPDLMGNISSSITLPSSDTFFGSDMIWESSHPHIIADSGFYQQPSEDTIVRLTYYVILEDNVVGTGSLQVYVVAKLAYTGYYADLGIESASGEALLNILKNRLYKGVKIQSYGGNLNTPLIQADKHPTLSGMVYTIYDGAAMKSSASGSSGPSVWNKEHVIPKSWYINNGYAKHEGDVHNLRISRASINTDRGNKKFVDGSGDWNKGFYPGDDHKGDVARIAMYMMVMMPDVIKFNTVMNNGKEILLRWHIEDPVDEFEINRNQVLYEYQHNRNPFIDHPELVEKIWGGKPYPLTQSISHESMMFTYMTERSYA